MEEEKNVYYNELAIASLTVAILSFINLLGLERSVAAIVFGVLALKRIKQDSTQRGKKMAIAGIVIAIIYTIIAIALMPQAFKMAQEMIKAAGK